jgi:hypothetical protein
MLVGFSRDGRVREKEVSETISVQVLDIAWRFYVC